ncbi:SIS domain-containing protein [Desulfurococcus mucosus]|nr:SIS domain-containing protein [Desulfurococcus mucosus]
MYRGWVEQLRGALMEWGRYRIHGVFNKIVVLGMGGSGIVGDFLSALSMIHGGLPVFTLKSHVSPGFIDSGTLAISVSYSGNTRETILATMGVLGRAGGVAVVSSGGYLRELALKHGIPFIPLPSGLAPRASLPSMLFKILGLLDSSGLRIVGRGEAEEAFAFIKDNMGGAEEEARRLAEWINSVQGLLVIATHTPLEPLAVRGKNEFNENSKIPVKVDVAPEWMHNDIVGYEQPGIPLRVVEVVDPSDRVGRGLVEFMHGVYVETGASTYRLALRGGTLLEKMMYGSLVLGLASCRLARLRGIDPLETKSIKRYKESVDSLLQA